RRGKNHRLEQGGAFGLFPWGELCGKIPVQNVCAARACPAGVPRKEYFLMKTENRSAQVQNLALAALFMAAGLVLPFLTGQIPQIGSMLLPMHLPVLLCGL